MKKRILFAGIFSMFAMGLLAQDSEANKKAQFLDNWFIQGQAGVGYTVGEASFSDLLGPSAFLSVGKYFNPIIASRLQIGGGKGKGGWSTSSDQHPDNKYGFDYAQANLDALFNLTNIFSGYKERTFNLIGIIGIGYVHSGNFDKIQGISTEAVNSAAARAGLQANFRLGSRWDFNIEGIGNAINDSYNGKGGSVNDWQFNLLAGFTYKFKKDSKPMTCTNNAALVQSLNDQINAQRSEIENLKNRKPEVQYVEREKVVSQKEVMACVAFKIGKSSIEKTEMVHVYQLAEYLKQNSSAKVTVTGYADVKTGSADLNQKLSQKRADEVAKALTDKFGITKDRITVDYKGASVQPFTENDWNRVVMMISK